MKFGNFLKIGLPVIGATTLTIGAATFITSCSNSEHVPTQPEAAQNLSNEIDLLLWNFNTNQQALENQADFESINLPNMQQNAYQSINEFVENFNKKNTIDLENAVSGNKNIIMVATWTPNEPSSKNHTSVTIGFQSQTSKGDNIDLKGQDNKILLSWVKVTLNISGVPTITTNLGSN